jgi:hypothetical protein
MIGLTRDVIKLKLSPGTGMPINETSANPRYNAQTAVSFDAHTHRYEVGFMQEQCCYFIARKSNGNKLQKGEILGFLYQAGTNGSWSPDPAVVPAPSAPDPYDANLIDCTYAEKISDTVMRRLQAQVHASRSQIVIWNPAWTPVLSEIAGNPI